MKEGGDQRLLLAIPPLTLLVVMLHTTENYRAALIGRYIATKLWPSLEGRVGKLSSWEARVIDRRKQPLHLLLPEIFLLDAPAMAIFILAGGYALVRVGSGEALWWIGCGALVLRSSPRSALPCIHTVNHEWRLNSFVTAKSPCERFRPFQPGGQRSPGSGHCAPDPAARLAQHRADGENRHWQSRETHRPRRHSSLGRSRP